MAPIILIGLVVPIARALTFSDVDLALLISPQ